MKISSTSVFVLLNFQLSGSFTFHNAKKKSKLNLQIVLYFLVSNIKTLCFFKQFQKLMFIFYKKIICILFLRAIQNQLD